MAIGLVLVILTAIIQAVFMIIGVRFVLEQGSRLGPTATHGGRAVLVSAFTGWMFIGMVLEALIWAVVYLHNPAITTLPNLETALYFSMATFTTVGYGDVVVTGDWRMLAAIEAANGMILFGWTTALIFFVIQRVYRTH